MGGNTGKGQHRIDSSAEYYGGIGARTGRQEGKVVRLAANCWQRVIHTDIQYPVRHCYELHKGNMRAESWEADRTGPSYII
jgi:hypothetical protein